MEVKNCDVQIIWHCLASKCPQKEWKASNCAPRRRKRRVDHVIRSVSDGETMSNDTIFFITIQASRFSVHSHDFVHEKTMSDTRVSRLRWTLSTLHTKLDCWFTLYVCARDTTPYFYWQGFMRQLARSCVRVHTSTATIVQSLEPQTCRWPSLHAQDVLAYASKRQSTHACCKYCADSQEPKRRDFNVNWDESTTHTNAS